MDQTKEAPALPDKPSELLTVALDDLEVIEKTPRYVVDMETWHEPAEGRCFVCLAGAVMAQRCDTGRDDNVWPLSFPADQRDKFLAINRLRQGSVDGAFSALDLNTVRGADFNRRVANYCDDPAAFKSELRQLAADLKAGGF